VCELAQVTPEIMMTNKKMIIRKGLDVQAPRIQPKFLIERKIIPIFQNNMQKTKIL
jgi:hypothetical protein